MRLVSFHQARADIGCRKKIVLLLDVNGEMCIFNYDGIPLRGLTNVSSGFDCRLGGPSKRVFPFLEKAQGDEIVDVWADAGCNDLFGFCKENGTIKQAAIAICNEEARGLFYDFQVLLDLMKVLPEDSELPQAQNFVCAESGREHFSVRW